MHAYDNGKSFDKLLIVIILDCGNMHDLNIFVYVF